MNGEVQPPASVFSAAVQWLQGTLLGTLATAVAVIAVASVGFLLLTGRIDVRRGAQVVIGCFIVFGASSIAAGIVGLTEDNRAPAVMPAPPPPPQIAPPLVSPATRKPPPFDPYAGAALPTHR
jgi:type IV secretory pathway VirB2 component (pilin)